MICAEAGLTVDAAFNRVAKELAVLTPNCDELALTAIELSFLNERRKAFNNLADVDLDVKGVVTTMVQTERYGTRSPRRVCCRPSSATSA